MRRRMVAIGQPRKAADLPNPVADWTVQAVLPGIARTNWFVQTHKDALTLDRLEESVKGLDDGHKRRRDRALLLLTFACALRRSEAAALDVGDLCSTRRGLVLTIRRSKTDQEGEGAKGVPVVANSRLCAATSVRKRLAAARITVVPRSARLTGGGNLTANRIDGRDVARLVQRVTKADGIDGDFAGHSLRAGFIPSAAETKRAFLKPILCAFQGIGRLRFLADTYDARTCSMTLPSLQSWAGQQISVYRIF